METWAGMDINMQHGHRHAAWTWDMQQGMDMNGSRTLTCSMYMDIQDKHGYGIGT
jgi:hypothetical protein